MAYDNEHFQQDRFIHLVRHEFERAARDGEEYTLPWLDLDISIFQAYRDRLTNHLPTPFGDFGDDPATQMMLEHADGLDVLLLAGGGGQQSAIYGLLGARVTVYDLMPGQLAGDQQAAAHYGYPVNTIQGDMHDMSALPDCAFDRVFQPISTLHCYNLDKLYEGVRRIIRPGGLYFSDYTFPFLYMTQDLGWDESRQAYLLAVSEPYQRGEIREQNERVSFTMGEAIGEYHYLFSDIINGLVRQGFKVRGLWESPRPDRPIIILPAGISAHRAQFIPYGISVIAEKE